MTKPNEGPNIINLVIQIQTKMILGSQVHPFVYVILVPFTKD
jgi:hypothetical protein